MTISIPAAITGAAQTGFTAPIYNTTVDTSPDVSSKQSAVTSLGGTQTGVVAHSVQVPFTLTVKRPAVLKILLTRFLNGVTGKFTRVPRNTYSVITRKGVQIVTGQYDLMLIRSTFDVPAGSDTFDIANVRAAVSAHVGALSSFSAGLGDTLNNGVM